MIVNHIEDRDLQTLRRINERLYDESKPLSLDDKRDLAQLMRLILDRVETAEVEVREPEHDHAAR